MVDPVDACLSPEFEVAGENSNRPHTELVNKTNSSLSVAWNVPQWQEHCITLSHPPLTYILNLTQGGYALPGYPLVRTNITKHLFILYLNT